MSNVRATVPNTGVQRTGITPAADAAAFADLGRSLFILFIGLVAVGCTSMRGPRAVSLNEDDEAIVSAVLADPYLLSAPRMANRPFLRKRTELTLVAARTIYGGMTLKKADPAEYVTISPDLTQSLSDRNRLARADLRGLLPSGWETLLDQTDPRGPEVRRIVRVSLPGRSRDGLQALVSVERDYNLPCCPEGYAVLLERKDGRWIIVAHGAEWIV